MAAIVSLARFLDDVADVMPEAVERYRTGEGSNRERLHNLRGDIAHEIVLMHQTRAYRIKNRLYDLLDGIDKYLA